MDGCLRKMDDYCIMYMVHTTQRQNHHSPKMDVLPKTFLQVILAAKWQVRHSRMSPRQQRRPLHYLLSVSSSMLISHKTTESRLFLVSAERNLGPKLHGVFPGGRLEEFIPGHALTCTELRSPVGSS